MNRFLKVTIQIHKFLKESCLSKTILQVTVKNFKAVFLQFCPIAFPAIFPSIECIQKNTSDKTYFRLSITFTVICPQAYP